MEKILSINGKTIFDIDTTILIPSNYNYTKDTIELLNQGCTVIYKVSNFNIRDIPQDILNFFDCEYLLSKTTFTKEDEYKIIIISSIFSTKKIIAFMNMFTYVSKEFQNKIIEFLRRQNKRIINYTSETEETLLLPYLIIIYNNEIVIEGETNIVLKEETLIKKLGFNLPFIVELSNGLKYYNVVSKLFFDNESLVEELWK
ncbi:MAG: hypothetical protein HFI36_03635 [Bacilli bacterium]|jgi:hypothetical protein|nr:hypothetical protein [Bacilli bacterium]